MPEIIVYRKGMSLHPVDDIAAETLQKIPESEEIKGQWTRPRHLKQLRLAWVLAQKCADACDWLFDRKDAMEIMKIKARHVRWITDPNTGEVYPRTQSIAFANLDQDAFDRVFNRFIYIICTEIVPGIKEDELRQEVLEAVDGDLGRRVRDHDARFGR